MEIINNKRWIVSFKSFFSRNTNNGGEEREERGGGRGRGEGARGNGDGTRSGRLNQA